jgi:hypothetical protein
MIPLDKPSTINPEVNLKSTTEQKHLKDSPMKKPQIIRSDSKSTPSKESNDDLIGLISKMQEKLINNATFATMSHGQPTQTQGYQSNKSKLKNRYHLKSYFELNKIILFKL